MNLHEPPLGILKTVNPCVRNVSGSRHRQRGLELHLYQVEVSIPRPANPRKRSLYKDPSAGHPWQREHSARSGPQTSNRVICASLAAADARAPPSGNGSNQRLSPSTFAKRVPHPHRQRPGIPPVCESQPAHVRSACFDRTPSRTPTSWPRPVTGVSSARSQA